MESWMGKDHCITSCGHCMPKADTWVLSNRFLHYYYAVFDYQNLENESAKNLELTLAPLKKDNTWWEPTLKLY